MTELHPGSLAGLVRSLAVLALPYGGQYAWLLSFGLGEPRYADELALELDAGFLLSRQFVDLGWLKPETRLIIAEIHAFLGERSGEVHESFWEMESLRNSPDWDHVRQLALKALLTL
jgi:hypothetical protein